MSDVGEPGFDSSDGDGAVEAVTVADWHRDYAVGAVIDYVSKLEGPPLIRRARVTQLMQMGLFVMLLNPAGGDTGNTQYIGPGTERIL